MNRKNRIPAWIAYLALVAVTLVAHACAVESDAQADAAVPARHV
ncbi:hypothetical protein [Cupriavidus numazuensis]|uniref:Lipoprotein n=1 Tax=Cupriavidus numazuensis TaxID=221992 RepID=A0ABM8T9I3_9BURK|nr:hypothetical protein [Cupriavidus numazuensis]CAG2129272.1 hypothetical protein LMG26411_00148 [Cupriavidus numazuensis]